MTGPFVPDESLLRLGCRRPSSVVVVARSYLVVGLPLDDSAVNSSRHRSPESGPPRRLPFQHALRPASSSPAANAVGWRRHVPRIPSRLRIVPMPDRPILRLPALRRGELSDAVGLGGTTPKRFRRRQWRSKVSDGIAGLIVAIELSVPRFHSGLCQRKIDSMKTMGPVQRQGYRLTAAN